MVLRSIRSLVPPVLPREDEIYVLAFKWYVIEVYVATRPRIWRALAAIKEKDAARNDLGGVTLLAVRAVPAAGGQSALDIHFAAFMQVLPSSLPLLVKGHDASPLRLFFALAFV